MGVHNPILLTESWIRQPRTAPAPFSQLTFSFTVSEKMFSIFAALLAVVVTCTIYAFARGSSVPAIRSLPFFFLPSTLLKGESFAVELEKYFVDWNEKFLAVRFGFRSQVVARDEKFAQHWLNNVDLYTKDPNGFPSPLARQFFGANVATVGNPAWRRQRQLVSPAFKLAKIRFYESAFSRAIEVLISSWEQQLMFAR